MPEFSGIPEKLTGSLQENILTLAASSDEHCKLVMLNVPLALYSNKVMREIATQVYNYIQAYDAAPKEHLVDLMEGQLDGADGEMLQQILENIQALLQGGFNPTYVVNQLSKFVRQQHLKQTLMETIEAAEKGDVDRADTALDNYRKKSYEEFSPGLTLKEYAKTVGTEADVQVIVPTGIPELDRYQLGLCPGELHLFMGPPKRGKTWWLLHLAKQCVMARKRVAYITLEVAPRIIAGRLVQSMLAMKRRQSDKAISGFLDIDDSGKLVGISTTDVPDRPSLDTKEGVDRVRKRFLSDGNLARMSEYLMIQGFPTNQLRMKGLSAYLENLTALHRFTPEVLIVDMAELMHLDLKQYRLALGMLMKDLRGMAVDRGLAMATATQSNRASLTAFTITEGHTSEDISKIGICDVAISYNQTDAEKEMNVARLHVMVARNARDKFSVGISQAYGIGQFYTGSIMTPMRTWMGHLPKRGRSDRPPMEGEEDDDGDAS